MHTLVIMPSGPHRTEGGSCVPGGGSEIFDPTVQNSHLPGLIASWAPAAHAHTSVTRMRMAVAPTAVAARIFASAPSRCCRSAHHGNSQASRAHERPRWVDDAPSFIVRKSAAVGGVIAGARLYDSGAPEADISESRPSSLC